MFTFERQQGIINLLKMNKSASVAELSKKFFIGETTIRRDLEKLEKQGVLKRTYGGAVLLEGLDSEIPLFVREEEQRGQKQLIGQLAAKLVKEGDIIIMDSSSTVLKMAPNLQGVANLTVITNGAKTAIALGELLHIKVYSTGGKLRENSLSYIGEMTRKCIQNYLADTLFFSCRSISIERGLSDINEEEAELRRIMIDNSKKVVLLCDSTKFDKNSFCRIGNFDKVKYIITDKKPSNQWLDFFGEKNIQLSY